MSYSSIRQHQSRPKALDNRTLRLEPLEPRLTLSANFLGMADATLARFARNLAADGAINRSDMIRILRSVQNEADRVVDARDLADLRRIVSNAAALHMPNHVAVLAADVVYSNTANARYQGAALGNLAVGNSNVKLGKLVDKWFYGADVPVTGGYAYASASGTLFGTANPSHFDEKQGYLGDCYFIAAMGSIADSNQAAVRNMFIANGDGTWTVRFYFNGRADYVTVNNRLPVYSGRYMIFDGYGSNVANANNRLWLPLLEKAYVQWNETGKTQRGYNYNNYAAIEGGWMGDVYRQALGYSTNHGMGMWYSNSKTTMISALNARQAVTVGTIYSPDFASTGLYGNHAYNVLSYNATTGRFTLYNPWGGWHPYELTWAQLSQNADWFSSTATTLSVSRSASPVAAASVSLAASWSDAALTTTVNTLELPATPLQTEEPLESAAVDAVLTQWDAAPSQTLPQSTATLQSGKTWVSDVASRSATKAPTNVFADIDTLFDSLQSQVTLAL